MPVKNVSFDRPVTKQEVQRLQAMAQAMRERPRQQVNHPLQAAANFANDAAGSITEFVANRREQKRREALIGALQGKTLPGLDPEMFASMMNNDPDQAQQMYINAQMAAEQARRQQAAQAAQWQRQQDAQRQADDRRALQEDVKAQRDRDWGREDYLWQREQSMPKPMTPEQRAQFGIPDNVGPVVMTERGPQLLDLGQQGPKPTDDMREYEYAVNQGYQGTFRDYMIDMKREGRTSVNINNGAPGLGKLSPDYGYKLDPETGQPVVDPNTGMPVAGVVPGSKAWEEKQAAEQAAKSQADAKASMSAQKVNTILDATGNIKKLMADGWAPETGTASIPLGWLSNTDAGKVRSYVKSLQSGVALNAMMRLKEASSTGATGFGALNAKELDLLISDIGALDPNNTDPTIFLDTVNRIENQYKMLANDIRRNVDPVRIQQLGLDVLLPPVADEKQGGSTGPGGTADPAPQQGGRKSIQDMSDDELKAIINGG